MKSKKLLIYTTCAGILTTAYNLSNFIETQTTVSNNKIETESSSAIAKKPIITEDIIENVKEQIQDIDYIKTNDYVFVTKDIALKEKDNDDSYTLANIEMFNKIYRLSSDDNWSYVCFEGINGFVKNDDIEKLTDTYVEVDISDQVVNFFVDNELLVTSSVVTGTDTVSPTRIGWFEIYGRRYDTYLRGPGYKCHVDYWMPFDGGIGLHDADWRSEYGGEIYKTNGSHGCVNIPKEAVKIIYENSDNGTKVLVHK